MALTPSTMLPLGTKAPDFTLPDVVSGETRSRDQVSGAKGLLVMFICNHCPYVVHIQSELTKLGNDYRDKEVGIVAISSNDIANYPEDRPERMKEVAEENGYSFPYLYDESQAVAKAYDAACTPDFFLFDSNQELVYRGQLDDSRPRNDAELNGKDLREALDTLIQGGSISTDQKPSMGCNIKWRD